MKDETVHYHANFALYVNGVLDVFNGPGYYEEVQACNSDNLDDPRARVHMHNNLSHVVHVHDHAATWGAFFANLGYTLGDSVLTTGKGTYVNGADGQLSFILNGQKVDTVANRTIGNEDTLLIDYETKSDSTLGNEDTLPIKYGLKSDSTPQERYQAIIRDAHEHNTQYDPATCSGGQELTFTTRLKKALGLTSSH
jgi:hypothetical protein